VNSPQPGRDDPAAADSQPDTITLLSDWFGALGASMHHMKRSISAAGWRNRAR